MHGPRQHDYQMDPASLDCLQRERLALLLDQVLRSNEFYRRKLHGLRFDPRRDPLHDLPLTTRAEIQQDQLDHPPYGSNLTFPLERYVRLHQTSGSSAAAPLRWLDTAESWTWFKHCWQAVLDGAQVSAADRVALPFSFGPFLGFWGAFEAAADRGCLCLPAGGMTTVARLRFLLSNAATIVCCTPTYALHMAEVARQEQLDLAACPVRALIVAGEPGGNIPGTRALIEQSWGARVFDHAGMTEIGAWGFEHADAPGGMFVIESEFIAEVIDPQTQRPVEDGQPGELVLTNLGRGASPLIRYRTGDQVQLVRHAARPCRFAWARGGVIGRVDDMLHIRGNNVFPSAIEAILREVPGVAEFRLVVTRRDSLPDLTIEIETPPDRPADAIAEAVVQAVRDRLNFRPTVRTLPPASLPRFELKAKRIVK